MILSAAPFDLKFRGSVGGMPGQISCEPWYSEEFRYNRHSGKPVTVSFDGVVFAGDRISSRHSGEFKFGPDLMRR